MKKYVLILIILISTLLVLFSTKSIVTMKVSNEVFIPVSDEYMKTLKEDIFSLIIAYPQYIVDIEVVNNNKVYLILKSGVKLLYDDGREKSELEKLADPDLQDMIAQKYVLGSVGKLMPEDFNPGRIRVYPLLKEVYGINQSEIEKNLIGVSINSKHHRFNRNNNAEHYLKIAIADLNKKAESNSELWSYIYPIGGTYNYRSISQTNRLSPHAFGISIDLASNKDDYWQWASRESGEKRIKNYPQLIVDIMESNYFIWGGKWGQFDILHFEYRPEFIIKAQYFSNENNITWYENLPTNDSKIAEVVCLIEERLSHIPSPNIKN